MANPTRALPPAVITDYNEVKRRALVAIDKYLREDYLGDGDRYGFFHGKTGANRARKAQAYLNMAESNGAILAILIATIGLSKDMFCIGRSSTLASLITDHLIRGRDFLAIGVETIDTIESDVIYTAVLRRTVSSIDNFHIMPSASEYGPAMGYTDKTKCMRDVLQYALRSEYDEARQKCILDVAARIKHEYESGDANPHISTIAPLENFEYEVSFSALHQRELTGKLV